MKMTSLRQIAIILLTLTSAFTLAAYEAFGIASWYGGHFHGKLTANGETFDTYEMTAAHKELPFNTMVTVINLDNGKMIHVRVNDRGPFIEGRIIDLSYAGARDLDMIRNGTANVRLVVEGMEDFRILYSIQVGAYKNLENAHAMKIHLEQNGLTPVARLASNGVTRILLENVSEEEALTFVQKLVDIGVSNPLVKQN